MFRFSSIHSSSSSSSSSFSSNPSSSASFLLSPPLTLSSICLILSNLLLSFDKNERTCLPVATCSNARCIDAYLTRALNSTSACSDARGCGRRGEKAGETADETECSVQLSSNELSVSNSLRIKAQFSAKRTRRGE